MTSQNAADHYEQTSLLSVCSDCAKPITTANYADGPRHVHCAWADHLRKERNAPDRPQSQEERETSVWLHTMRTLGYAITGPWYERSAYDAEGRSASWDIPRDQYPIKGADAPHLPYVEVLRRGCPGGPEVPERDRGMGGVWVCYLRHWHPLSADERRARAERARDVAFGSVP